MSTKLSSRSDHRACDNCGYSLRGLPQGGTCPECGAPTRRRATRSSGTMSDEAPASFVRRLRAGFLLATIGILTTLVLSASPVMFLGSCFWIGGIFLATSPRPHREEIVPDKVLDNDRFRLVVRGVSLAWPLYALAILAVGSFSGRATPPSALLTVPLNILRLLTGIVAWVGLLPTCVYFAELSYWSSHDNLAQRLRSTAWATSVFGTLTALLISLSLLPFLLADAAGFASIFTTIIVVLAVVVFFFTVVQLTSVMGWVLKHQKMAAGSAQRVRERVERETRTPGRVVTGLRCASCGYNLNGLPFGGRCPECGESYADMTPMAVMDPARMRLDRDESEIEIEAGESKGIYFNEQLDSFGKPKAAGVPYTPAIEIPDEGDIPMPDDEEGGEPDAHEQDQGQGPDQDEDPENGEDPLSGGAI